MTVSFDIAYLQPFWWHATSAFTNAHIRSQYSLCTRSKARALLTDASTLSDKKFKGDDTTTALDFSTNSARSSVMAYKRGLCGGWLRAGGGSWLVVVLCTCTIATETRAPVRRTVIVRRFPLIMGSTKAVSPLWFTDAA